MRLKFALLCALLALFGHTACLGEKSAQQAAAPAPTPAPAPTTAPPRTVEPIDMGNGVFYFPVVGEKYQRSLADFYKEKPYLHCDLQGFTERLVEENTQGSAATRHMATTGFILHCHDIAINAQDVTVQ